MNAFAMTRLELPPPTVLLVDDSPVNLRVVVESLESQGYEVLVAQDGEEALQRAEATGPDLILLDVMMPELDGFEICRRLKAQARTRDIPVIFMTSLHGAQDKVAGFGAGAVDYVTKPLQIDELRARVGVHLKLRELQRQLEEKNLKLQDELDERKRMEERLRMAASVFEVAREGIILANAAGVIEDVNPAFVQITGYARDEVIGKKPSVLSSGRHGKDFYAALWKTLSQQGAWSGELVNRRKDGEIYTEHLSITSVRDDSGKVTRYVGIFSDISLSKHQERRMEYIAHHDALTGLPNRVLLSDRMQQAISHAHRSGEMLAVLYLDLDGFKPINDKYGHEVGDRVLIEIAGRMKKALRASDTAARIGGDEFVLLLPGQASMKECEMTTRRLLSSIAAPMQVGEHRVTLSASIGISIYPTDDADPDALLRDADQAMYAAKRSGRNQFVFCSRNVKEKTRLYSHMAHELRLALIEDRIEVHYQPIVELATGSVLKAEALARWTHPELGVVPPAEFIPIAEEAGLIQVVGERVFRNAVRVAREWNRLRSGAEGDGRKRRISINCSPRQFYTADGLAGWCEYLYKSGGEGEFLDVEITESLLLDDRPEILKQLNQLRSMGMTLSLDDFGTGFSALSYLKKFDIDFLKIDRFFVRDLEDSLDDKAIVEAIVSMAHRLGIVVIAEGVETDAQATTLASAECDLAQGYLFARPMPEREFLDLACAGGKVPINHSSGS
jgi:diguanylate cyclase (GGDEF)-like protein/PAS domain S-box-containing protein